MLRNCTAARYELNKARMVPLAEYSRDRLRELCAKYGITYDERSKGTLQLFRTQKMLDGTAKDIAILKKFGVPYELLDVEGCVASSRRWVWCGRKSRAACGCPATRPATASSSPMPWPQSAASTPESLDAAPTVSILDDATKIVTSRLGRDRYRVAGTAEFSGFNRDIRHDRIQPLIEWSREQFPKMATEQSCRLVRPATNDA